jgi:WD40 repeat protein
MKVSENSATQVVVDAENPWPGLDYFVEKSRSFFHGREAEADLLLTMVRHRVLTVLYGQSGLGKSSLLQAGLFPRLRADGRLPVYIRLSLTNVDDLAGGPTALLAQTRQCIRDAIAEAIEEGQLLPSTPGAETAGEANAPFRAPREDESLWEYLHRRVSGLQTPKGEVLAVVLVFDQFEEIFTLGRDEMHQTIRRAFLGDLADCVENRLPEHVRREMERQPRGSASKYSDLDFNRQDYRIILSLREDYLAELHDLSDLMPSIHENETRLVPLNGWQALDAVSIPGETLVEPVLAREIVEIVAASRRDDTEDAAGAVPLTSNGELTDESKLEVDPALLSMVCRELNIERQRRKEPKITQQITDDLLKTSGRSILHRFYRECFQSLSDRATAPEVQRFVEDELLTPDGYRNMVELVRAQHRLASSGVPDPAAAIQELIDQRLLRVSERRQDKTKWLELTHDVLCDVVKESRRAREIREAKEREERAARERATRQLKEAERQRAEAEAQAEQARQRETDAVARLKQVRRERNLGIAALVLLICFAGSLCVAGFLAFNRFQTGAAAEGRSRVLLDRAKERLSRLNDDRRDVYALRMLGRAVRVNPSNAEAVKLACQLLVDKNWCPPLSPALKYSGSPLLCAAFSPDNREVVAVGLDGNLVRWSADNYTQLPSIPLVPDKMAPDNKLVLTSASFSKDGKRVLLTFPPGGENARVLKWSDQEAFNRPKAVTVDFKGTIRSVAWSRDGNSLFIFPLRFDQSNCRVFRFDGRIFKEAGTIPNTTTGDLSPDDRLLAIASTGGRIQLWDPNTLQEVPPSPDLKTAFGSAETTQETRFFSLLFSDDGGELAGVAMREPARIWSTRSGTSRLLKPKSQQDQIMRIAFGPNVGGRRALAAGMNGMVGLWDVDKLDQLRAEPICVPDAFVYPTFSSDGNTLISLSGPVWLALDAVRVWDVSLRKSAVEGSNLSFSGKSPPVWLPDLAEAVGGLRPAAEEEETGPAILSELRKEYAGSKVPPEYAPIWNRFLAKQGQ